MPPDAILVLRATLRQRTHQFDGALKRLAEVLARNPRNAQARLTRATVLQVQGAYDAAREECLVLKNLTRAPIPDSPGPRVLRAADHAVHFQPIAQGTELPHDGIVRRKGQAL